MRKCAEEIELRRYKVLKEKNGNACEVSNVFIHMLKQNKRNY